MDKTIAKDSKIDDDSILIHTLPDKVDVDQTSFGLTIFGLTARNSSPPRINIRKRVFRFYGISHLLEGKGWRWVEGGRRHKFNCGNMVFTPPGLVHDYGGDGVEYSEDALSFYGPLADSLFHGGIFRDGIFFSGAERPLLPIIKLSLSHVRADRIEASILLQNLLLTVYQQNRKQEICSREVSISRLIDEMRSFPEVWWSVARMAEFCSLSESQFRVRFRNQVGVAPKKFVDQFKNKLACQYLISTDYSVERIARKLGFVDPLHFSRKFSRLEGISPTGYRRSMTSYPEA